VQGGLLAGTIHQAEEALLCCGATVDSGGSGYTGSGFVDGYTVTGVSTTFAVNVPASGPCAVTARYNAVGSAQTLSVVVNGTKTQQATFAPLANANVWDFETETVNLVAGANTIAYVSESGDTGHVALDALIDCVVPEVDAGSAGDAGNAGLTCGGGARDGGCATPLPLGPREAQGAGCGCRVGRGPTSRSGVWAALAMAVALLRRRRRFRA
jgi:MYXO-CTERM domain-containing protein